MQLSIVVYKIGAQRITPNRIQTSIGNTLYGALSNNLINLFGLLIILIGNVLLVYQYRNIKLIYHEPVNIYKLGLWRGRERFRCNIVVAVAVQSHEHRRLSCR